MTLVPLLIQETIHEFDALVSGFKVKHRLRTIEQNGQPWIVLSDVSSVLGITGATAKLCLEATQLVSLPIRIRGGRLKNVVQDRPCVSLSGLSLLASRSRKSIAPMFLAWVEEQVTQKA